MQFKRPLSRMAPCVRTLACSLGLAALALAATVSPAPGGVAEADVAPTAAPAHPPAETHAVDKREFSFGNPTPSENLREMNALYDSPWTVDAGHFQLEMYTGEYSHNHTTKWGADSTSDRWNAGAFTLKAGLRNNLDLEVAWTPYSWLRRRDNTTGAITRQHGFGDLVPRVKLNLWGNDGGTTALALLPFVKVPTGQDGLGNRHVEGGLIVPLGIELPLGWWAILINESHWLHDFYGGGYHPAFANTVYFWHQIQGNLSGFVDFYSWASTERRVPWWGSVDLGLTYLWSKNVQLDLGVSVGVSNAADDVNPYLGLSFRF